MLSFFHAYSRLKTTLFIFLIILSAISFLFLTDSVGLPIVDASSNTYYVAKTGSNTNSGTESSPFLTIGKGLSVLSPGDTLYIKAGTYAEFFTGTIPSGISWNEPITIKAFPGDKPKITDGGTHHVINLNNDQTYVIMEGLEVEGGLDCARTAFNTQHIKFINMELHGCSSNGFFIGGLGNVEISGGKIYNNGDETGKHGVYIAQVNVSVHGVDIYNNYDAGIKHSGSAGETYIYDNYLYGNRQSGVEANADGGNHYIYNNVFATNETAAIDFQIASEDYFIYNNLFIENPIAIRAGFYNMPVVNINLANNIFYSNDTGISLDAVANHDITISNSIFFSNGIDVVDPNSSLDESNRITQDPLFAKVSENYYVLSSGSPAIDAGSNMSSLFIDDLFGVSRPQGSAYDIGPFEFVPDSIQSSSGEIGQTDWSSGKNSGQITNTVFSSSANINYRNTGEITLEKQSLISNATFDENDTGWVSQLTDTGSIPTSVSNLFIWLDANEITGLNNGDPIDIWEDQGSNNYDFIKFTDGTRPLYKTDKLFGKPVVFSNSSILTRESQLTITNFTAMWVYNSYKQNLSREQIASHNGTISWIGVDPLKNSGTTPRIAIRAGGVSADSNVSEISANKAYIYSLNRNSSSVTGTQNLVASDTMTVGTGLFSLRDILSGKNSSNEIVSGSIGELAELIIYDTNISGSDEVALTRYLANKYAITLPSYIPTDDVDNALLNHNHSLRSYKYETVTYDSNLLTRTTASSSDMHNIEVFVYTDGSEVTSSDVELYVNGSTLPTSFEAVANYDGWYRLSATLNSVDNNTYYGVQVKADKTVYMDDFSIYNYPDTGTLTSSVFNTNGSSNWGTLSYTATTPNDSSVTIKVRTANNSDMSDATSFSECALIGNNEDISINNCVDDGDQYIQYQAILASSSSSHTPTLSDVSINFETITSLSTASLPAPERCTFPAPTVSPNLFEIKVTDTTATVFFTPIRDNNTGYYISYSTNKSAEEHGAEVTLGNEGVQNYTINELKFKTTYYFKVRGQNRCATGDWSNILSATTLTQDVAFSGGRFSTIKDELTTDEITADSNEKVEKPEDTPEIYDVLVSVKDNGQPIGGVYVEIHSDPKYGTTDENGEVLIEGVVAGEHTVRLSYNGLEAQKKIIVDGNNKEFDLLIEVEFISGTPRWMHVLLGGMALIIVTMSYILIKIRLKFQV